MQLFNINRVIEKLFQVLLLFYCKNLYIPKSRNHLSWLMFNHGTVIFFEINYQKAEKQNESEHLVIPFGLQLVISSGPQLANSAGR